MMTLKQDNERLMKSQTEQEKLSTVLLQSLSKIQNHLQQGLATSNAGLQQFKNIQIPLDNQKHGPYHKNLGRIYSRKRHMNDKKKRASGDSSIESSNGKTTIEVFSISDIESSIPRKKMKRHSQTYLIEEFKLEKIPTFDGEIKKGEEAKAWLLGLRIPFLVHNYSENTKENIAIFNLNG